MEKWKFPNENRGNLEISIRKFQSETTRVRHVFSKASPIYLLMLSKESPINKRTSDNAKPTTKALLCNNNYLTNPFQRNDLYSYIDLDNVPPRYYERSCCNGNDEVFLFGDFEEKQTNDR